MSRAKGRRGRKKLRRAVESIRRMKLASGGNSLGRSVILAQVRQGILSVPQAYLLLTGQPDE